MAGHYKFWVIQDPDVAKNLGVSTEDSTGDIYVVREVNPIFNSTQATTRAFGYDFSTSLVMKAADVQANPDEGLKKLQELSFNAPIIVHDEMQFRKRLLGLPTLLVYCDP